MRKRTAIGVALAFFGALAVVTVAVASRTGSGSSDRALFGVLVGKNEVGGGDPDGFGSATGVMRGNTLCFGVAVKGLDQPAAAHIHFGKKGVNGPVVVPLTAPATGDPGTASGCVPGLDPALVAGLIKDPGKYYWNVHTTAFAGGAIRGQLFTKKQHADD